LGTESIASFFRGISSQQMFYPFIPVGVNAPPVGGRTGIVPGPGGVFAHGAAVIRANGSADRSPVKVWAESATA
jgi:hypothetical protein